MIRISSSEAIGHLVKWNNVSMLGCVYTCGATGIVLNIVNATLAIRGEGKVLLETAAGRGSLLPLDDRAEYSLLDSSEFPRLQHLPSIPTEAMKIILSDKSVCHIFPEP
jgi:hypothetical protein